MAKTSRKTAAKKKKAVAKKKSKAVSRGAAAKPKAAAAAKLSPAAAKKEYAALERRGQVIWQDMESSDAAKSKRAAAAWKKFIADFQAFAKKYSLKIMQQEKTHDHSGEPAGGGPSPQTSGCVPTYRGHDGNGNPFVCHFVRYSRIRGKCIYTCGFDPNGYLDPF